MIQVVRWYMSTFHAGRKSPVAKKPYNPILGEIFQCWYTIPPSTKTSTLTSTTERDKVNIMKNNLFSSSIKYNIFNNN